jgi:hypothetical protein
MKEIFIKSFWQGVKTTFHDALKIRLQPATPWAPRPRATRARLPLSDTPSCELGGQAEF